MSLILEFATAMRPNELEYWRGVLVGDKPLTRAQRTELLRILESYVNREAGKGGNPGKTALQRTYRDFSTGIMDEAIKEEMAKGVSLHVAAATVAKWLNWKAAGRKKPTGAAVLKRVERWRR